MAVTPPPNFYRDSTAGYDEPLRDYGGRVGIYNDANAEIVEVSTDTTMAADSDTVVPTQKAVKAYVITAAVPVPLVLESATPYQLELKYPGVGSTTIGHDISNFGVISSAAGFGFDAATKVGILNTHATEALVVAGGATVTGILLTGPTSRLQYGSPVTQTAEFTVGSTGQLTITPTGNLTTLAAASKLRVLNTTEAAAGGTDGAIYTAGGISSAKTMQCSSMSTHGGWIRSEANSTQLIAVNATDTTCQLQMYVSATGDSSVYAYQGATLKNLQCGHLRYSAAAKTYSVMGHAMSIAGTNPTSFVANGLYGMWAMPDGAISSLFANVIMPEDWEPATNVDIVISYYRAPDPAVAEDIVMHIASNVTPIGTAVNRLVERGVDVTIPTSAVPGAAAAHQQMILDTYPMAAVTTKRPLLTMRLDRDGTNVLDTYTGVIYITDWYLVYTTQQPGTY